MDITDGISNDRTVSHRPATQAVSDTALRINFHDIMTGVSSHAAQDRYHYKHLSCAAGIMLGDLSIISRLFLITDRTDMRLSVDGLMSIIRGPACLRKRGFLRADLRKLVGELQSSEEQCRCEYCNARMSVIGYTTA